jgi:5-methylcytosine-specific restriction endonuclease McrA
MKKKKSKADLLKDECEELWKSICIKRDKGICQWCGEKAGVVHHIRSRGHAATFVYVPNGMSLCLSCHAKISLHNRDIEQDFDMFLVKRFGMKFMENLKTLSRKVIRSNITYWEERKEELLEVKE